jgi:hypothetical protein
MASSISQTISLGSDAGLLLSRSIRWERFNVSRGTPLESFIGLYRAFNGFREYRVFFGSIMDKYRVDNHPLRG